MFSSLSNEESATEVWPHQQNKTKQIIFFKTNSQILKMPRCFMAKKLKYPYEQWKEQQNKPPSRSPSPMEAAEDEGFSSSSSSPQTVLPLLSTSLSPRSDYQEAFSTARHIYGKLCSMLHDNHLNMTLTSHSNLAALTHPISLCG